MKIATAIAALLLTAVPALASAAPNNRYLIIGVGNSSCGQWTAERRKHNWMALAYEAWVTGYITAWNRTAIDGLGTDTDVDGMTAWVDNYCAANPLNNIAVAAQALLMELLSRSKP